jgi:hypothetical protein
VRGTLCSISVSCKKRLFFIERQVEGTPGEYESHHVSVVPAFLFLSLGLDGPARPVSRD